MMASRPLAVAKRSEAEGKVPNLSEAGDLPRRQAQRRERRDVIPACGRLWHSHFFPVSRLCQRPGGTNVSSLSSLALRPAHTASHRTSRPIASLWTQKAFLLSWVLDLGSYRWQIGLARLYSPCGAPTGAEGR